MLIPDKFVPPLLLDRYVEDTSSPWQSTVHNRLFLGIPSLALARHSLTTGLRAHDAEHVGELEDLNGEVYQERILTSSTYTQCVRQSMNSTVSLRL